MNVTSIWKTNIYIKPPFHGLNTNYKIYVQLSSFSVYFHNLPLPQKYRKKSMKVPLVLIFLVILKNFSEAVLDVVGQRSSSKLTVAMADLVVRLFEGKFTNIRIISSFMEIKRQTNYEIVSDFIIKLDARIKVTIEEPKTLKDSPSKRGSPVIILVHSSESFELIREKFLYDNLRFRKFYLIVLLDGLFADFEIVIKTLWNKWIYNFYVLDINSDGSVEMLTVFPFDSESCGQNLTLKVINCFNATSHAWQTKTFAPQRFDNLNSCPISVAVLNFSFPSVITESSVEEKKIDYSGFEIDIFKQIAMEFNASTVFTDFDTIGSIFENGTTTKGVLSSVFQSSFSRESLMLDGETREHLSRYHDAALGTLSLQYERARFLTETKCFLSTPLIFVIPPSSKISAFQKLTRPLTVLVWALLIITVLFGFAVIVCLRHTSKNAYSFVVGRGVNYPYLNMMIGFLGTTQNKLPKTNFARFILMKFLIFCLIIRCLYTGKLSAMLQTDLHEKQVDTIEDMMQKKMTFYAYESLAKRIVGFRFANRSDNIIDHLINLSQQIFLFQE